MPELPEVETIRRQLERTLGGRRVAEAGSHPSAKFTPARDVTGARLLTAGRRGKFLLLGTDDGRELVIHLGMTGALSFGTAPDLDADPYLRAWWRLVPADGRSETGQEETLLFHDVRRFGRIRVVPAGDYIGIPALAAAGPEPFDVDLDGRRLWLALSKSRRRLKTQLLSQRPIAGVGNIYADEALWLAGISPYTTSIGLARATRLLEALRQVLGQGIDNGGTTLRDYRNLAGGSGSNQTALAVYGRAGAPCLRCGATLRSAVLDARTTTWCPSCQRR
ncbi:MAG: bifunctional DNA-formamidopyrimidine glycosylase/DNA-(apurinic or apyrimidinic site) lyase [Acidimicrobiia bacterium]|nr:bifunctional DNA-formamidopyrimidine glycosylase/DNA-(apurinic or apyrimidinic site) lyase [Acidimicrobiia bacterium]MDH4363147.1 bifunctional DNA-formamidopyrimidine glycosylase/DNA-(apurinic or apyrimidinic site) lyase [Acidimicrobiia bacterium]MDH5288620.1 bifunctional DNA-formamidopyrimidine glycosylase/DNA-(apurinic or apyrimidinic site) lyase [Acidimicrobiia bacterium]